MYICLTLKWYATKIFSFGVMRLEILQNKKKSLYQHCKAWEENAEYCKTTKFSISDLEFLKRID